MIDGNRLNEVVRSNIETLCRHFFPTGHKDGGEWKIADVSGAKGNSLGIAWEETEPSCNAVVRGCCINLLLCCDVQGQCNKLAPFQVWICQKDGKMLFTGLTNDEMAKMIPLCCSDSQHLQSCQR
jgi:hypothetical protein